MDDTRELSAYLVRMLTLQRALQTKNNRSVVKPTRLNMRAADGQPMSLLIVGEADFAAANSGSVWFAALNGLSATSAVATTGGSGVLNRLNWETFKSSPQFAQFVDAIRTMRANTTVTDPESWRYWANIHQSNCPHGTPYFLAWHRGYIYLFERKIQQISGNADFRLPYWDYYTAPEIPSEFTNDAGSNPLHVAGRSNTNVRAALSLNPFSNRLVDFQRGEQNPFEPSIESRPHNQVHNIVGRPYMLGLQSPRDPVFWVHHANIDRLWSAWVAAGSGRTMPPASAPYWAANLPNSRPNSAQSFKYGSSLTLERNKTIDPRQSLAYDYDNTNMPTSLPAAPARPSLAPSQPPSGASLGPGNQPINPIMLASQSVSLALSISQDIASALNSVMTNQADSTELGIELVFSGIQLTTIGQQAGFGFLVYLNLPAQQSDTNLEENHFVGTVGPFEIAGIEHDHNGQDAGEALKLQIPDRVIKNGIEDPREMTVSFIRVNGDNAPDGEVISIRDVQIRMERENVPFNNS